MSERLPKHLRQLFETAKAHGLTFQELKLLVDDFNKVSPEECKRLMEHICEQAHQKKDVHV